ncbi:MAG: di-trans,poly-cis-decaprenylcistransferase [Anaerolineaceae bacterium]|nr:di-trans,poly-cis-decaprenylcistransferase [Anaerolineaceae bacterium]
MTEDKSLSVPRHVAIIMDGNGRWARARGLPRLAGHRAGTENLRPILEASVEFGIEILTIWAFSTENWRRPEGEVRGLLGILRQMIRRELKELHKQGVRLRHIGRLDRLPQALQKQVQEAIELTRNNDRIILNVAFDYGGRAEIVQAVRRIVEAGIPADQVDEALLSSYMYTAGQPDPDLIIRTSGELRTSGFMLWQSAYTEYYVTETFWPDFDKEELRRALLAYAHRDRRFGGIKDDYGSPHETHAPEEALDDGGEEGDEG